MKYINRKALHQRIFHRLMWEASLIGIHFHYLYYAENSLLGNIEAIEASIPVEIRKATEYDLNDMTKRSNPKSGEYFEHATAIGSTSYVAINQNKVAGYIWVNRRIIDLLGMYIIDLPENGCYTHRAFVYPEYRRKRVFQSLLHSVYRDMKNKGCIFAGALIHKPNIPPIAVHKRLGAKFQNAHILKLPRIKPIIVGKRFKMGISVSEIERNN